MNIKYTDSDALLAKKLLELAGRYSFGIPSVACRSATPLVGHARGSIRSFRLSGCSAPHQLIEHLRCLETYSFGGSGHARQERLTKVTDDVGASHTDVL